jgi:predicted acylesterase/phospholipase RssA
VLVNRGCNSVIAVSVTAKMEHEFGRNRPDTPVSQMRPPSTLQTILRSFLVQSVNMNSVGVQPADVVIEPDVTGFDLSEFSRADEIAAVGEATAKLAIPKIGELLRQLDDRLFSVV